MHHNFGTPEWRQAYHYLGTYLNIGTYHFYDYGKSIMAWGQIGQPMGQLGQPVGYGLAKHKVR